MKTVKYCLIAVVVLSIGLIFGGCSPKGLEDSGIDVEIKTDKIFVLDGVTKSGVSLINISSPGIEITNSVPIVFSFSNGVVESYNIEIYLVNADGSKSATAEALDVTKTKIFNLGVSSELYLYTSFNLLADTTYEIVIKASSTKSSLGQLLDGDGNDGIAGETEDNIHYRFIAETSPMSINTNKFSKPLSAITVPSASALIGVAMAGSNTIHTIVSPILSISNNAYISTTSVENNIKLFIYPDMQPASLTVNFDNSTNADNLAITLPSTLTPGIYAIRIDSRLISESTTIDEYTHWGSYDDSINYSVDTYIFNLTNTNGIPIISSTNRLGDNKIYDIYFSMPMDTSTLTAAGNILIVDYSTTNLLPVSVTVRDDKNILVSVVGGGTGTFDNIQNSDLDLILKEYMIKAASGNYMGTNFIVLD